MIELERFRKNHLAIFLGLFCFVPVSCSNEDLSADLKSIAIKTHPLQYKLMGNVCVGRFFFLQGAEQIERITILECQLNQIEKNMGKKTVSTACIVYNNKVLEIMDSHTCG